MLEPYFHVTYSGRLEAIDREGLRPGSGRGIGARSLDFYRVQGVFVSDAEGVPFWFQRAQEFAEHAADDPLEEGLVPVVLRVWVDPVKDTLVEDPLGAADSRAGAWIITPSVADDCIELWVGEEWVDLVDGVDQLEPARGLEWDEVDAGGYWYQRVDSPLEPDDDALYADPSV